MTQPLLNWIDLTVRKTDMRLKKANNALLAMVVSALALSACTQETQNQISRSLNNWTGTDGILEI
ncbi:MAG: hypothetical protein CR976_02045, partial [Thiotrichales bacterium]